MKYCIQILALGKHPEIELSGSEYQELKKSRAKLIANLSISEKFELMLQNYIELEKELLINSVDLIVSPMGDYLQGFESKLTMNRRIVNLLTSTKLYIDQAIKHIRPFFEEKNKDKEKVESYFSDEYEKSPHYRFMEALRNHVQHYDLAVHSMSNSWKWIGEGPSKLMELRVEIFSKKDILEEDKKFKKILGEVGDEVDLNVSAREYIGCLKRIHLKFLSLIEEQTNQARELHESYIEKYKEINNQKIAGLCVLEKEQAKPIDKITNKFPLILAWDDIRLKLNDKHKALGEIEKMFVSGALATRESR